MKKLKTQEKNAVIVKKGVKPKKPTGGLFSDAGSVIEGTYRPNKDIDEFFFDEEEDAAGDQAAPPKLDETPEMVEMDVTPPFIEEIGDSEAGGFEDDEAIVQSAGKDGKMKSIKQMAVDRKATQVANKKSVKDAVDDGEDFLNEGVNQQKLADKKTSDNRKQTEAIKKGGDQGGW